MYKEIQLQELNNFTRSRALPLDTESHLCDKCHDGNGKRLSVKFILPVRAGSIRMYLQSLLSCE